MKKTVLILWIIFLLLGAGVVSSTEYLATESKKLNINHKMKSPTVLLDEDFSGDFPPEGWSMDGWEQYNSSCCGSEPPCAIWYKYNQHPPYYGPHVTSKAVDASEYEKFVLSFYFGVDVYYNNYVQVYLKYRRNETNPWIDITPWCNPITSDMCDYYEIEVICGSECCGDALQINWSYVGYYYGINYCWLDNVKILSGFDDTPPVTNCSLDPPEPNGDNGWYITDVNVTLDATDDISGVKEIHYRINDDEWNTYYGDFLTFVLDYDCLKNASIEYYSVDNAENQEETKILEGIYIDQEPPYFDAQYEILSGNPKDGWLIGVNASNIIDDCSGWSGRVEFLLNGVLQDTVTGPEPEYMWQFYYSGGLQIIVGVRVCDNAGNCVTKEFEIKLSRNKNHLFMDQMFLRFLDRFPLILRILNI